MATNERKQEKWDKGEALRGGTKQDVNTREDSARESDTRKSLNKDDLKSGAHQH